MPFNENLAQRNSISLPHTGERWREGNGYVEIIRGGNIAMPVRRNNKASHLLAGLHGFVGMLLFQTMRMTAEL